ncbi:peptidoglycan DD-metalloendopeptidase family protein [Mastigocladopsis repens]|uniref:peptidoglycan DD-metalloendopeptidase family protein n=1 Tax=Mastigocladopsis repens TaxID=221287 RepID=UPI0002D8F498|nr:peptidoglycan DD-metalloendopeptidase family protein [Mastigocladopsis repens]
MKRALKKRVQAELENTPSDDAPVEQIDAVNPRVNQSRMPKTAAMIGLAISMGATSLLVTRQSEQAVAAEPLGNQNTASTIPASDTEVKFAPTKKLDSPAVLSVSVPESPAIVEPTVISQIPRLGAKWEVAANNMSVQASAPVVVPSSPKGTEQRNIASETTNVQQSKRLGVQTLSNADGIAGVRTVSSLSAQPQIAGAENTVEPEVNAQLKAQQEFALNRLQEKSNRLRKSLADWRSQDTGDLSQQTLTRFPQPMTVAENLPISTITATEHSDTTSDISRSRLVSSLKQRLEAQESSAPVVATPTQTSGAVVAPTVVGQTTTATKYEVKPGDTLAAIALNYGTSVLELVKANSLSNPNQLQISQKLAIPVAENPSTTTIAMKSSAVVSSGTTKVSQTSASPVIANNTSVTVPTPVVAENQFQTYIQSTTANSTENTTTSSQTTSSTVTAYGMNGVGGDAPVPKVFTEIQLAQRPTATTAKQVKNSQGLRSLHEEIEKLRAKYRSQQFGNAVVPNGSQTNDAPMVVPVSSQNDSAVPISVPQPNDTAVQIPVTEPNTAVIPIPVPRPMTPNYSVKPGRPTYRANQRPANEPINPELLPNQAIATPSMGGDASQSLGSLRGTTVYPQLPPLAAVDRYLPKPIDENTPPPSTSTTAYIWPAKGTLTSGYGRRWGRMHKGIDIANSTGTPIYAAADGVVEKAGWNRGGYGNLVDIRHADGSMSRYGHNSKILVQPGQQVHQGQTIAFMGSTGFSTGPHSHFEIHPSGKGAVNPIALLPGRV